MKAYDVWTVDKKGNAHRVAHVARLGDARAAVKPYCTGSAYVYVLRWLDGKCFYLWGWLAGHAHTADLRSNVRSILKS